MPAAQDFVWLGLNVSEDGDVTAFLSRKPVPVLEHPSGKNAFPVFGQKVPSQFQSILSHSPIMHHCKELGSIFSVVLSEVLESC